jgi:hypothetical protein
MDWVQSKAFGLVCGEFADVFVRGEAFEGFESPSEVVGCDEVVEVRRELGIAVAGAVSSSNVCRWGLCGDSSGSTTTNCAGQSGISKSQRKDAPD